MLGACDGPVRVLECVTEPMAGAYSPKHGRKGVERVGVGRDSTRQAWMTCDRSQLTNAGRSEKGGSMTKRSAVLAAAAAAIFVTGAANPAIAGHHEAGEKVKCDGVNSCKGQSECNTDHSACHGKNECAGKGWVKMTPEECAKAKAAQADE